MKKQLLLFLLASIGWIANSSAQPNWLWANSTGGVSNDNGNSIATDALGNIFTTGGFTGTVDFDPGMPVVVLSSLPGSTAAFISKTDSLGDFGWAKAFSGVAGSGGASITSMVLDAAGNIYTTGNFFGSVDFDPDTGTYTLSGGGTFISKLDANGNFSWARQLDIIGNAKSIALSTAGSGALYTTGNFFGNGDFDPGAGTFTIASAGLSDDIYVSKLDTQGNFVWARCMGGTGTDLGFSIQADGSGNVFVTGDFDGTCDFDPDTGTYNLISTGGHDIFVARLNVAGDLIWARQMGGTGNDEGWSIAVDPSGNNLYSTGRFEGSGDFDPGPNTYNLSISGNFSIYISKLDGAGNFSWAKGIGGAGNDIGRAIKLDASGNFYVTGNFGGTIDFDPNGGSLFINANAVDVFVSKYDGAGNMQWTKTGGGNGYDYGNAVSVAPNGEVVLTGFYDSPILSFGTASTSCNGSFDIFVSKLDWFPTGITHVKTLLDGQPYPNPASGYLMLPLSKGLDEASVRITDLAGKIVFSSQVLNADRIELNTSAFSEGIYFVQLQAPGIIDTRKFIIAR